MIDSDGTDSYPSDTEDSSSGSESEVRHYHVERLARIYSTKIDLKVIKFGIHSNV